MPMRYDVSVLVVSPWSPLGCPERLPQVHSAARRLMRGRRRRARCRAEVFHRGGRVWSPSSACLVYGGSTTGDPKGVIGGHPAKILAQICEGATAYLDAALSPRAPYLPSHEHQWTPGHHQASRRDRARRPRPLASHLSGSNTCQQVAHGRWSPSPTTRRLDTALSQCTRDCPCRRDALRLELAHKVSKVECPLCSLRPCALCCLSLAGPILSGSKMRQPVARC